MRGDLETKKDILPLMLKGMLPNGIFDPSNRINILNVASDGQDQEFIEYCLSSQ